MNYKEVLLKLKERFEETISNYTLEDIEKLPIELVRDYNYITSVIENTDINGVTPVRLSDGVNYIDSLNVNIKQNYEPTIKTGEIKSKNLVELFPENPNRRKLYIKNTGAAEINVYIGRDLNESLFYTLAPDAEYKEESPMLVLSSRISIASKSTKTANYLAYEV